MKTIEQLAAVLLTVDRRLGNGRLVDELQNQGLGVDDDLHRELYAAVAEAAVGNIEELVEDDGGSFIIGEQALSYLYQDDCVLWTIHDVL